MTLTRSAFRKQLLQGVSVELSPPLSYSYTRKHHTSTTNTPNTTQPATSPNSVAESWGEDVVATMLRIPEFQPYYCPTTHQYHIPYDVWLQHTQLSWVQVHDLHSPHVRNKW